MGQTDRTILDAFKAQNRKAVAAARVADRIEPRARSVRYDADLGLVIVQLRSGDLFGFPPDRIPALEGVKSAALEAVELSPSRDGLHWHALDAHASLSGLMIDSLNLREWAPRIMGQARSPAKIRAARANGRKGGRPRKPGSPRRA